MQLVQLFGYYFLWHYGPAFLDIWVVSRNMLWFLFHFFSIGLLLKTFFSPFQRLHETYQGGIDIWNLITTILANIILRIVGMVVRFIVIILGLVVMVLAVLALLLLFVSWAALPLLVPTLFMLGVSYL